MTQGNQVGPVSDGRHDAEPTAGAELGRRGVLHAMAWGGLALAGGAAATGMSPAAAAAVSAAGQELAEPGSGILPYVRVTPPTTSVAGVRDHRVSLDGRWGFSKTPPTDFAGNPSSVPDWDELAVPGHFALQGYGRMYSELGVAVAYQREFEVPRDWEGNRIRLHFDQVDGLARVWVNGQLVGEQDTAFMPSEFDVTDHVRLGRTNTVALTVARSELTAWSAREMGGITESVFLQALPQVNLARLHVVTDVSGASGPVTVRVLLGMENQTGTDVRDARVQMRLRGPDGRPVNFRRDSRSHRLPMLPATGQVVFHTIEVELPDAVRWDAEHPNLYRLECVLQAGRHGRQTAERTFGFCDASVQGADMVVNGQSVKLRGSNHHFAWPGWDFHPPVELIRRDLELMRGANLNYLRPRLTAIPRYVDLADEMGFFISMDAPLSLMQYSRGPKGDSGNNDRLLEPVLYLMAVMVERYRSHPSIVLWSLANECQYYPYFQTAAAGVAELDPKRPRSHSGDLEVGIGIPEVNVNDDHYPRDGRGFIDEPGRIEGGKWSFPDDRPILFTEWSHVHMYNKQEQRYDPGIFDYWGHYVRTHIDYTYDNAEVLGGAIFTGSPLDEIVGSYDMGFFDKERRINDSYWHALKANSPVRIPMTDVEPTAGTITVEVVNRHDFTNLSELEATWRQGSREGTLDVDVAPRSTGTVRLPYDSRAEERLELVFRSPRGYLVDRYLLGPVDADSTGADAAPVDGRPLTLREDEASATVEGADAQGTAFAWVFDRRTGLVRTGTLDGTVVVTGGPHLAVNRSGTVRIGVDQEVLNMVGSWQASQVSVEELSGRVRVTATGAYDRAAGSFTIDVHRDGGLTTAYDFEWTAGAAVDVFDVGVDFDSPLDLDTLGWNRKAQWSAYPDDHIGRPAGTAPLAGAQEWLAVKAAHVEGEPRTWPWSQDVVDGASRDFRSTKTDIHWASLTTAGGTGYRVHSEGRRQHVHAFPAVRVASPPVFAAIELAPQQARFVRLDVTRLGLPLRETFPEPVSRLQLAELQVVSSADPDVVLSAGAAVTASETLNAGTTWNPRYVVDGRLTSDEAPKGYTSQHRFEQDVDGSIWIEVDLGRVVAFDTLRLYPRTDVLTEDGTTANFPEDFTVRTRREVDGAETVAAQVAGQVAPQQVVDEYDSVRFGVRAFCNGGTDGHLMKSIRIESLITAPGTTLADTVRLSLVRGGE